MTSKERKKKRAREKEKKKERTTGRKKLASTDIQAYLIDTRTSTMASVYLSVDIYLSRPV